MGEVRAKVWRTSHTVILRWLISVETPRVLNGPTGASWTPANARRKAERMIARERKRVARHVKNPEPMEFEVT